MASSNSCSVTASSKSGPADPPSRIRSPPSLRNSCATFSGGPAGVSAGTQRSPDSSGSSASAGLIVAGAQQRHLAALRAAV